LLDLAFGALDLDWKPYVKVDPRYYRPTEVDVLMGDASKAKQRLGWRPTVTFPTLVRMMVQADLETERQRIEGVQPKVDLCTSGEIKGLW
jgi:GDPmannose 4,6-dehydratase